MPSVSLRGKLVNEFSPKVLYQAMHKAVLWPYKIKRSKDELQGSQYLYLSLPFDWSNDPEYLESMLKATESSFELPSTCANLFEASEALQPLSQQSDRGCL